MEQHLPPAHEKKPVQNTHSLRFLIRKYFWYIVIFFVIAITSGVLLAEHEAKSTANWETYTSKDAGVTFQHPKAFKIIEDKGWRITAYTSEKNPENNIKILYSHNELPDALSTEEQFLANCQAKRVSEITAKGGRMKVYEDSTCGGQVVENSVLVYAENGMTYDIGLFGKIDRTQLYLFLSTFRFEPAQSALSVKSTEVVTPSRITSPTQTLNNDVQNARAAAAVAAKYTTDRKGTILHLFDDGSEDVPIYPKGTTIKLEETTWKTIGESGAAYATVSPQNQKVFVYFKRSEGRWWITQIQKTE